MKNYYAILGVSRFATDVEIKKRYRKLALDYHPDRNKGNNTEVEFKEILEAYQTLSDIKKRNVYDERFFVDIQPPPKWTTTKTYTTTSKSKTAEPPTERREKSKWVLYTVLILVVVIVFLIEKGYKTTSETATTEKARRPETGEITFQKSPQK